MNLFFDTRIIILLLGIGYIFTLILIIAYEHNHLKKLIKNTFFLAKFTQTIAWFFMILRGLIPDFFSISFANSLLLAGYAFEIIALLSLKNTFNLKTKKLFLVFSVLSIIGFQMILIFYNKEYVRIAYMSFAAAVIYLPVYRVVFTKVSSPLMKIIGSMYIFFAVSSIIRGVVTLTSSAPSTSFFTTGNFQLASLLTIFIFTNLGSIGFILLMKEKVDQELIHFASYDDLTGALNRRTFTENAKQYLTNAAKKGQHLSYILFDVDNFKAINDTHGHHIGDLVLEDLTKKIKQHLDKDDLLGRYGGDEFGILMPGKDEIESTKTIERIIQSINDGITINLPVAYTISLGIISIIPEQSTQLDVLYTNCDKALYESKRNGRNGITRSYL